MEQSEGVKECDVSQVIVIDWLDLHSSERRVVSTSRLMIASLSTGSLK